MSPKDGIFTAGVMFGIILCVTGARALGIHHIVGLIVGVLAGAGIGYVAQQAYINSRRPPDQRDLE
jgi:hypothetical protein